MRRRRGPRRFLAPLMAVLALARRDRGGRLRRHRDPRQDPRPAAAREFAAAWAKGDRVSMWKLIDADTQKAYPLKRFSATYRAPNAPRRHAGAHGQGREDARRALPRAGRGAHADVRHAQRQHRPADGPQGRRRPRPLAPVPAPARPAAGREREAQDPLAPAPRRDPGRRRPPPDRLTGIGALIGTAPGGDSPGSGLQRRYDERLGGRPGAELRFGHRLIRRVKVRRGHTVRATIRPGPAARRRAGARQPPRRRRGDPPARRRRCSRSRASPSPARSRPGSTFKIITLSAALQNGIAKPSSTYPVRTAATLSGVLLRNASNESCGGSLADAFADSCNSVFAPLGAKLGARRLVAAAERFGFNERRASRPRRPRGSRQPSALRDSLAVGAAAIGQDRDLATPLAMASVGATIAEKGVRAKPRIVARRPASSATAPSAPRSPAQVRTMMIGVVQGGTGTAARIPGVAGRGQDRHGRAAPDRRRPARPEEHRRLVRRLRAGREPALRGRA